MAHPERCFLGRQYCWLPRDWPHEEGRSFRLFQNARRSAVAASLVVILARVLLIRLLVRQAAKFVAYDEGIR